MAKEKWIQKALGRRPGALRRQLGIKKERPIPRTLLVKVAKADVGDIVRNPTSVGRRQYRVTRLLKRRAVPVLTVHRLRRRRRGKLVR
jgi:hypothetical protein